MSVETGEDADVAVKKKSEARMIPDSSVVEVIDLVDTTLDINASDDDDDYDPLIEKKGLLALLSDSDEDAGPLLEFYPIGNLNEKEASKPSAVPNISIFRSQRPPNVGRSDIKSLMNMRNMSRLDGPSSRTDRRKRKRIRNRSRGGGGGRTLSRPEEKGRSPETNGIATRRRNLELRLETADDDNAQGPTLNKDTILIDESDAEANEQASGIEDSDEDVIIVEKDPLIIVVSDTEDAPGPSKGRKRKKKHPPTSPNKKQKLELRPIVIDGSNVAFGYGRSLKRFDAKGIQLCVDYFVERGHEHIIAFVPQFRRRHPLTLNPDTLDELEDKGFVTFTPSRHVNGKNVVSYDDRYIVEYANKVDGVIVSRDNFRDIWTDSPDYRNTIDQRLLMFTFAKEIIMFPEDPLGRKGPSLNEFLSLPDKK